MLERALDLGFKHDHNDKQGKTPYDYALEQQSGVMKKVFEEKVLGKKADKAEEKMDIDQMIGGVNDAAKDKIKQ
jgi:hypothetical protein